MHQQFYIKKAGKTLGPFALDDLCTYLAYGSASEADLVLRVGDTVWMSVCELPEFRDQVINKMVAEIMRKRRVARYRDYDKVPSALRSRVVIARMILGFVFFPPLLWNAVAAACKERIYTREAYDNGLLKSWPNWVSRLLYALLVMNAVVWLLGLWILITQAEPLTQALMQVFKSGAAALRQ